MEIFFPKSYLWILSAFSFVFGLCIGSFLNVCIWRLPREESLISPRSKCPCCGHLLAYYENIPLVSWIFLKGKCSSCSAPISPRYIFVEFLTGILFLLIWIKVLRSNQPITFLLLYLPVTALCISTFFIDIKHFIIPDLTTYPLMISGLIVSFFFPEVFGYQKNLPSFIFSLFSLSASLVFMSGAVIAGKALFKRDALGWGDVKFIGAIGACLGIKAAFFTLLIGSVFGSLFGLYLILFAKKKLKTAIPFGPFLSIAAITYIFFGEPIISAYLRGCQTSPTSQTSQTNHAIKF